jgi:hypothetical protein
MGLANLLLRGAGKLAPAAKKGAQLASKIKVAKANKIASTVRKTCSKGKNCSATCISASKICLVSLSPPVSDASNKMAKFLRSRQKPEGSFTKATYGKYKDPVDTMKNLSKEVEKAQIKAQVAKGSKSVGMQNTANMELENAQYALKKAMDRSGADKLTSQLKPKAQVTSPLPPTPPRAEVADMLDANGFGKSVRDKVKYQIDSQLNVRKQFFSKEPEKLAAYMKANEHFLKLTDDQLEALGLYGTEFHIANWPDKKALYRDLNKVLRTGSTKGFSEEELKVISYTAGNLEKALEGIPPVPKELYRGLSSTNAKSFENMKVGDEIADGGFGSFSDEERLAQKFVKNDGAMLVVKSKTARDVSPVMPTQEGEHIALPGTKYKVVSMIPDGFSKRSRDGSSFQVPLITLEEVF